MDLAKSQKDKLGSGNSAKKLCGLWELSILTICTADIEDYNLSVLLIDN